MVTYEDFVRALKARGLKVEEDKTYDYKGYFESDPQAAMKTARGGGHFPDTFKTPNHPTFSNESKYSAPWAEGGSWTNENGTDVFHHSDYTREHVDETDDYLGEDYRDTGNVTMSHDGETYRLPTVEVEGALRRYGDDHQDIWQRGGMRRRKK